MLYDTVLLRTFVAICDSGSFTKAAREVNLTQSAVSLHVKRLEDQVGKPPLQGATLKMSNPRDERRSWTTRVA
jgi:DNA-binding transcriptional LysR family regulator